MIYCQMVAGEIPEETCADEQDEDECIGCAARTRRCLQCGSTGGIANPQLGLCARCVQSDQERIPAARRVSPNLSDAHHRIDSVLVGFEAPHLRSFEARSSSEQERRGLQARLQLCVPDRAKDTERLLDLLLEHAQPRADGTFIVQAPLRILNVRGKLTIDEACGVLEQLKGAGRISGKAPWTECMLAQIYAERILQKRQEVAARTSIETVMPDRRRRVAVGAFSAPAERVSRRELWTASRAVPPRLAPAPSAIGSRQMPSHAIEQRLDAAVAVLAQNSIIANGERVVRGAVPLLQIKLRIGPALAVSILERLRDAEHLKQNDGWRSIVLLKEEIPVKAEIPAPLAPSSSTSSQAPHLRVISSTDDTATVDRVLAELSVLPTADDRTIETLEEALTRAREKRDELTRLMEGIEARIATLRAAKEARVTARQLEEELAQTIRESSELAEQLFCLLRGDASP